VRQGKQRLAVANISGAMMIQATVPSAFGLLFTRWIFDAPLILSGAITLASITAMLILLRRKILTALRLSWLWVFLRCLRGGALFFAITIKSSGIKPENMQAVSAPAARLKL
jgi:cation:H+ antiporter